MSDPQKLQRMVSRLQQLLRCHWEKEKDGAEAQEGLRILQQLQEALTLNDKGQATDPMVPPTTEEAPRSLGDVATMGSVQSLGDVETMGSSTPEGVNSRNPASASINNQVPGYQIVRELGRGGMGVVYEAIQLNLKRTVALKMILAGGYASESQLQRFRIEAEAAARLQHPHIVQIYEIGDHNGLPYFSLELCSGGSLANRLNGTPWTPQEAATVIETLARAMQAAHAANLVHRDLKPDNVLLTEEGTPKITDFGLVKKLDAGEQLTKTESVMGTPSYMAPEQAAGQTRDVGPRADIYALGAILYELLTGRPPFKAATPWDTVEQVIHDEPVTPRLLNPNLHRDLETICLKCLEKQPDRRYSSAEALADDLARFRNNETITARSYNVLSRLARTLEYGQKYAIFKSWGTMLLQFAVIVMIGCSLIQWHLLAGRSRVWVFGTHGVIYALVGALFWRTRKGNLLPGNATERQLWATWIAYFLTAGVVSQIGFQIYGSNWSGSGIVYPFHTAIGGLTWFILGTSYWGGFYIFGLVYFFVSYLMALNPTWSPLAFGLLWGGALSIIGARLRHLASQEGTEKQA